MLDADQNAYERLKLRSNMNNQTKIGLTLIGSATAVLAGSLIELVPMTLAHLLAGMFMFGMAYFTYHKGELISTVGVSSLAVLFLTLTVRGATGIGLFPLPEVLLAVAVLGALYDIVSGIRG